jgi:hypothetical protein
MKYFVFYNNDAQISNEDAAVLSVLCLAILLCSIRGFILKVLTMNLESLLDLALAIGRVVLALVFIGCILTLLFTQ